jgi:hypothetical protein
MEETLTGRADDGREKATGKSGVGFGVGFLNPKSEVEM